MNENDRNKLNSAFENIDDRLVEEALIPVKGGVRVMMKRAFAACAALVVAAAIPLSLFIGQNPSREPTPQPPIGEETRAPETSNAAETISPVTTNPSKPQTSVSHETTEAPIETEFLPEEFPVETEQIPEEAPVETEQISEEAPVETERPTPMETAAPEETEAVPETTIAPETSSAAEPEARYPTFDLDALDLIPTLTVGENSSTASYLRYSEQSKDSESYVTMDLTTEQLIKYFYNAIPTVDLSADSTSLDLDLGSIKGFKVYQILDTSSKIPQFIATDIEITDISQLALHPGNYYVAIEIESSCEIDGWHLTNIFDAVVEVRVPTSDQ